MKGRATCIGKIIILKILKNNGLKLLMKLLKNMVLGIQEGEIYKTLAFIGGSMKKKIIVSRPWPY